MIKQQKIEYIQLIAVMFVSVLFVSMVVFNSHAERLNDVEEECSGYNYSYDCSHYYNYQYPDDSLGLPFS